MRYGDTESRQQLEGVDPVVAQEAGNAPQHAQRLNGTSRLYLPHVRSFPAELIQDPCHHCLRCLVIATNEHCGPAALELWIHHASVPNRVESFDEANASKLALKTLHQRLIEVGEKSQDAIRRRLIRYRVRRIDHRFA